MSPDLESQIIRALFALASLIRGVRLLCFLIIVMALISQILMLVWTARIYRAIHGLE